MLRSTIKRLLARAGYDLVRTRGRYSQDGILTLHNHHFRNDPLFRSAYERGLQAANGVDPQHEWRVHVALWAAAASLAVPGDFMECGVNVGFISSAIMHRLHWNDTGRRFFLIDTFTGPVLEQYSREEIDRGRLAIAQRALKAGSYLMDVERARSNFAEWPNAIVVQGAVPEILHNLDIRPIAFLHIDMNCAYPERAALELLWPHLSPGGFVLLDDYAYFGHDAQALAMDEAAEILGTRILSLPTGQGLIIKGTPLPAA